jgi:hypothetical protein
MKALSRAAGVLVWVLAGLMVALLTVVGGLFLCFSNLPPAWARSGLAVVYVVGVPLLFVFLKPRWKALVAFAVSFALLTLWFQLIPASNTRQWQDDVARVPSAEIDGDSLTLHNVRNFRYRSSTDYDSAWETRHYDLSMLRTLDIFFSYWSSSAIAHSMLSFGFDDGQYLCLSVETRKEIGEEYDPLGFFFKRFELIYVLGDERDLIALRTSIRREDTYLFPRDLPPARVRALLLDILQRVNSLARKPEHYRTVRDNCMTSLVGHMNTVYETPIPFSFKLVVNGYMPELAYERGQLPQDAPFDVVKQRYAISTAARDSSADAEFSKRIRADLGAPIVEWEE